MINHKSKFFFLEFLIVSACLASLQKFLKCKFDAVRVPHLHSAARALSSPSRCQILTMICLVVFCAEMPEQFSPASKGY